MSINVQLKPSVRVQGVLNQIVRYISALLLVIAAFIIQNVLNSVTGQENWFLLFFSSVIVSAWMGGLRAGLVATGCAALLRLFMLTADDHLQTGEMFSLFLFLLQGLLISVMAYNLRASRNEILEAFENNQERLRLALEATRTSLYTHDRHLRYTWIYNAHPDFTSEQILGKRDDDLLPLESIEALKQLKHEVLASGQRRQQQISTSINDKPYTYMVIVEPQLDNQQRVQGLTIATVDITEVQRTQAALHNQEHFNDAILRTLPAVVYIFDTQTGANRFINPYAKQALGYTPEEILQAGAEFMPGVMHPEDQTKLQNLHQQLATAPGSVSFEYRMRHKNGRWRWFSAQHTVFRRDHQGQSLEIIGIALDITDRKQAELALRESEEKFRVAFKNSSIAVSQVDADLRYTWLYNPHPAFNVAHSLGKRDDELIPEAEARQLMAIKRRVLETGVGERARLVFNLPEGSAVYDMTAEPLLDETGAVIGVTTAALDVTQHEQLYSQLHEREVLLQIAKQAAQLGIHDYNVQTGIIEWDERTRQLWGVGQHDIITYETFMAGIHPDDLAAVQADVDAALAGHNEGRYTSEYRVIHRVDGVTRWILATGQATFVQGQAVRLIGAIQDITAYKDIQEQLQVALAQYRDMAESMPQLVWTATSETAIDYYNSRMVEYDGIVQHEDGTWSWQAIVHPDDRELTTQVWHEAVKQSHAYECEHRIKMRDGSYRWHISRAMPVATGPGGLIKWYGTATDVHELKLVEEALRESEARFRNMADHAPVMVWMTDAAGSCTYLSQSWYAFTGQMAEVNLDVVWLEAIHPDDRAQTEQQFLSANENQQAFRFEYRLQHVDGHYRWAIDTARPRYSPSGEFLGYIGSVIDISDRKQAEEALRVSEEKYRSVFSLFNQGFCICEMLVDASGTPYDYRFVEVNALFEAYTGLRDATGKTALELVPDLEPYWIEVYGTVALTGEPLRFEQGSAAMGRWFDVYAFKFGEAQKLTFALVFNDITDRKQAEDTLREQREILEQIINSLPVMITIYEPDTRLLYLNREYEWLTGWGNEDLMNIDLMEEIYPDPDYREMARAYMQSLEPGWREFVMTDRNGTPMPSSWANIRLPDGRQVGIGIDIRERKRAEERSQLLQELAATLNRAVAPQEVTRIIINRAITGLGAAAGTVAVLTRDKQFLEIMDTVGYPDWITEKWRSIPLDHPTAPVALAVREERALWMRNPEERAAIIPPTPNLASEEQHQAWAVLPFNVNNNLIGVFGLGFNTPQAFDETERAFFEILVDTCAQALERALLTEQLQHHAAVEERDRLSRDLHDSVKQIIFASSLRAEALARSAIHSPEKAIRYAEEVATLNRAALSEMQILLLEMRPDAIVRTPFMNLVENLCTGLRGHHVITVAVDFKGPEELFLPPDTHVALYRIVQEVINNVNKHSEATHLAVKGHYDRHSFHLAIRDNGRGFDLKRASMGFGLNTMQERARSVNAAVNIRSVPGDGTEITVAWPAAPA